MPGCINLGLEASPLHSPTGLQNGTTKIAEGGAREGCLLPDAFLKPCPAKNLSLRSGPIPAKRKTSPIETRIIRPFPSPATCSGLFRRVKQWNPTHRPWPETHMPPGLNREQTSAWALDNFPALGGHSCQFCRDGTTVQAGCCI